MNLYLYLSRLLLNPRSRQVMSELAHPYEMHRTLMRAFTKDMDDGRSKMRNEYGILFRVDTDAQQQAVKVYVQSRVAPDWSVLDKLHDYLYSDPEMKGHEYKDIMPACRNFRNGQVFSFRLRANPIKRVAKRDDAMKGKRVGLKREEEQIAWLIRKGATGGFELLMHEVEDDGSEGRLVPRVNVCCEGMQTGRKKEADKMTHWAVLFDGQLRVTDSNAFLETLIRGVGPGKAFGCGLFSIARA